MKFFLSHNCNRRFVTPSNRRVTFDPIECFAGSWRGVVATENEEEIALMLTSRGVTEITQAEYGQWLQKKTNHSREFNPLPTNQGTVPVALTGPGAQVVENPSSPEPEVIPVDVLPQEAAAVLEPTLIPE